MVHDSLAEARTARHWETEARDEPVVTFCADFDGYLSDALFAVSATSKLSEGTLLLVGRSSPQTKRLLLQEASNTVKVEFLTNLEDLDYFNTLMNSNCLLVPYSDSLRNDCRFPSKVMDYLSVGSNIVIGSSKFGARMASKFGWVKMAESPTVDSFAMAIGESCKPVPFEERLQRVARATEQLGQDAVVDALLASIAD